MQSKNLEILSPDCIQKYISRPVSMTWCCLADFLSMFTFSGSSCRPRTKPCILQFNGYIKERDPQTLYLLFFSFMQSEAANLQGKNSLEDAFNMHVDIIFCNMCKYYKSPTFEEEA